MTHGRTYVCARANHNMKGGCTVFPLHGSRCVSTCNCDPSCYNCLRSYENQKIHDQLDRHLAENFLEQFVGSFEILEKENVIQAEDSLNEKNPDNN